MGSLNCLQQNKFIWQQLFHTLAGESEVDSHTFYFYVLMALHCPTESPKRNSLPEDVMMATGTDGFQRGSDRFVEKRSISGY